MSIHLEAKLGEIAGTVLLPGDPCRAQFLAETYLENLTCYNQVRGALGFTGTYQGNRVSVQSTGMGVPSILIYLYELINEYQAKRLIRIGTCGAMREDLGIGDVILAMSASTDSATNHLRFHGQDFAPTADFELLRRAWENAASMDIPVAVGPVLTHDIFYVEDPGFYEPWARYGVLAVEMETAGLYTLAQGHQVQALTILTVSDNLVTGAQATATQREKSFTPMMEIGLSLAGQLS
ncbi:purine-nucleoside phosphorylase [Myxococcota bacterium]